MAKETLLVKPIVNRAKRLVLWHVFLPPGQYVPPFVVMKGQRYNDNFEIGMPPGTKIVLSQSGYMKWEQFSQFLDHFISIKPSGPVVLILDGHGHIAQILQPWRKQLQTTCSYCVCPHTVHTNFSL